jgi:hypothetical protein
MRPSFKVFMDERLVVFSLLLFLWSERRERRVTKEHSPLGDIDQRTDQFWTKSRTIDQLLGRLAGRTQRCCKLE